MRLRLIVVGLALAGACRAPSVSAPEPVRLKVDKLQERVVRDAGADLTAAGFQVTSSDRQRGQLTAQLSGRTFDLRPFIKCAAHDEDALFRLGTTTLTVTVNAQPDGSRSEVVVAARATTKAFQGGSHAINDDTTCVSSGAIEARVARALQM